MYSNESIESQRVKSVVGSVNGKSMQRYFNRLMYLFSQSLLSNRFIYLILGEQVEIIHPLLHDYS